MDEECNKWRLPEVLSGYVQVGKNKKSEIVMTVLLFFVGKMKEILKQIIMSIIPAVITLVIPTICGWIRLMAQENSRRMVKCKDKIGKKIVLLQQCIYVTWIFLILSFAMYIHILIIVVDREDLWVHALCQKLVNEIYYIPINFGISHYVFYVISLEIITVVFGMAIFTFWLAKHYEKNDNYRNFKLTIYIAAGIAEAIYAMFAVTGAAKQVRVGALALYFILLCAEIYYLDRRSIENVYVDVYLKEKQDLLHISSQNIKKGKTSVIIENEKNGIKEIIEIPNANVSMIKTTYRE